MKLSMWMIANRLSFLLDIQTEISLDAKPILNSARLVYATNCVHVYQDNNYIVYDGEGDRIRIPDLSLKEAFEIVQGVFDYYQDWDSRVREDIREMEYQRLIDRCNVVFQNPMILMDANYCVLAQSQDVPDEEMDEEWNYLKKYGYSSLKSIRNILKDTRVDLEHHGYQSYPYWTEIGVRYGGASYNLHFDRNSCGRITVLDKNRPLNPGDYQLLAHMAGYLEPVLGAGNTGRFSGYNEFYSLLFGKPYREHELEHQLHYYHWDGEDTFQAAVLEPQQQFIRASELALMARTVQRSYPQCMTLLRENQLVLLCNRDFSKDRIFLDFLRTLTAGEQVRIGFSLTVKGYKKAEKLYQQAVHALHYGRAYNPQEMICHFEKYSIYYIFESANPADRIYACHPVIRQLWGRKIRKNDELYDTLKCYLDNERSLVKTAEQLFTHRNTVLYRIRKCQSLLNGNLDDPMVRYYIRISMYCLETFHEQAAIM